MGKELKIQFENFFKDLSNEGMVSATLKLENNIIKFDQKSGLKFDESYVGTQRILSTDKEDPANKENSHWEKTQKRNTLEAYNLFIEAFPQGMFIDTAKDKRDFLIKDEEAWQSAKKIDAVNSYRKYLKSFPEGAYKDEAENAISDMKQEEVPKAIRSFSKIDVKRSSFAKGFLLAFISLIVIGVVGYFIITGSKKPDHISDNTLRNLASNNNNSLATNEEGKSQEGVDPKGTDQGQQESDRSNQMVDSNKNPDQVNVKTIENTTTSQENIDEKVKNQDPAQIKTTQPKDITPKDQGKSKEPIKQIKTNTKPKDPVKQDVVKDLPVKDPEPIKKPPVVQEVNVFSIPKNTLATYHKDMYRLRIPGLSGNTTCNGEVRVKVNISEKGRLTIQTFMDSRLSVKPLSKRSLVVQLIKWGISAKKISPPKDKSGRIVRVKNWTLNYTVGYMQNKIMLTLRN